MDTEPIYKSEVTEVDYVSKLTGDVKKVKRLVATIRGVVNGYSIGEKTEIINRHFIEEREKEKLYKRYNHKAELHRKYTAVKND